MRALRFLKKVFLIVEKFTFLAFFVFFAKCQFFHSTCTVAPCICRNSICMAPVCEWILHMLQSTVEPVTLVTLLVTLLN